MQLPMGFTHEQFIDGQRAAEFLGLPRKTLLNLARRNSVTAYPIEGVCLRKVTHHVNIT